MFKNHKLLKKITYLYIVFILLLKYMIHTQYIIIIRGDFTEWALSIRALAWCSVFGVQTQVRCKPPAALKNCIRVD